MKTLASFVSLLVMAAPTAPNPTPCESAPTVVYTIPVKQMPRAKAKTRLIEALHQSLRNDESHKLDLALERDIQRLAKEIREEQ